MSDSFIPNTFQTPNAIVDRLMFLLTDSEFRVLMFMVRHILGWQKKAATRRASISLSNFENGFTYPTPDGEASYPGCGVGLNAIRRALEGLQKYRIIEAIGKPKAIGQEWELRFMVHDDVDFPGLALRQQSQNLKRQKQTSNARKVSPKNTGVSVQQIEQEVICSTDSQPISSTDREGISPTDNNEISWETHSKDQKDIAPTAQADIAPSQDEPTTQQAKQLINVYKTYSKNADKSMLGWALDDAKTLLKAGITPEHIKQWYQEKSTDVWVKDKLNGVPTWRMMVTEIIVWRDKRVQKSQPKPMMVLSTERGNITNGANEGVVRFEKPAKDSA